MDGGLGGKMKKGLYFILIGLCVFLVGWLSPNLPKDQGGHAIQELHPYSSQSMTADTASTTCSTALVGQVVRLYSTVSCFINFGSASVVASSADCFLPATTVATFASKENAYLAVIAASTTGTLYITDMY